MKWLALLLIGFFVAMTIYGTKESERQETACRSIGMHHYHMRNGSEICLPSVPVPAHIGDK